MVGWGKNNKWALGLFWVKRDLTLKNCIIYILVLVYGAKIVPNVVWHCVFFCLSVVCGWSLLIKTHLGREEFVYVCAVGVQCCFSMACWIGSMKCIGLFLLCFLFSPSTARRAEQHTYTQVSTSIFGGVGWWAVTCQSPPSSPSGCFWIQCC